MLEPTPELFAEIRQEAERACEAAARLEGDERLRMGAVNWGDLGVGDIIHCRNDRDEEWLVVEIGEASPGCGLTGFVGLHLSQRFKDTVIEVRAEW